MMEVKLIVVGGKSAGQEIPVAGPKFFIGRAEDCHLRPHSDQVSRHHCAIIIEEGFVAVRDFGSRNGTFVNGQPVKTEHELKMGDRLKVGPLELEVRLIVDVGGKKKPKVKSIQEAAARTVESAGAGPGEDEDVAEWLMDEEEEAPAVETETYGAVPTGKADKDPFVDPSQDAPAAEPGAEEQKEREKPVKMVGRFEPKKASAEDSRTAAADMLREFFKRK
jgi:predicted component of type VI protein secretion system